MQNCIAYPDVYFAAMNFQISKFILIKWPILDCIDIAHAILVVSFKHLEGILFSKYIIRQSILSYIDIVLTCHSCQGQDRILLFQNYRTSTKCLHASNEFSFEDYFSLCCCEQLGLCPLIRTNIRKLLVLCPFILK